MVQYKVIVLLGPPGSGKGTQAVRLGEGWQLPVVAPGELFRQAIAGGSALGTEVARFVQTGQLVPDQLTVTVIHERLDQAECRGGAILDGYPRTLPQAHALDQHLGERHQTLDRVLYFQVTAEDVIARLSQRRLCRTCGKVYNIVTQPPATPDHCDGCGGPLTVRDDDQPEAIRERLRIYEGQTAPVVEYYRNAGILTTVDASQPIAQVSDAIARALPGSRRVSGPGTSAR